MLRSLLTWFERTSEKMFFNIKTVQFMLNNIIVGSLNSNDEYKIALAFAKSNINTECTFSYRGCPFKQATLIPPKAKGVHLQPPLQLAALWARGK